MRRADPIVERFLPEVADTLREVAAVAKAAEGELAANAPGEALELLFDQQIVLQSALSLLRVMHVAHGMKRVMRRGCKTATSTPQSE
jgi:hypothetical protein